MPYEKRAHLILNRRARHLRDPSSFLRAISHVQSRLRIHETHSLDELNRVASAIAKESASHVLLAGGDGSHMFGVNAIFDAFGEKPPVLAFLPAGTVNTIARNWGFSGRRMPYIHRLLTALYRDRGRVILRPSMRVVGRDTKFGFIFGAGLVTNFFHVYTAQPNPGILAALGIVARTFVSSFSGGEYSERILGKTPCVLTVDGVACAPKAWSLIGASVVPDLGLHMRLTYRANDDSERIHLVGSALSPKELGPQMPRVLLGRKLRGASHVDTLVQEFSVSFTSTSENPPRNTRVDTRVHTVGGYVLDGETFQCDTVTITPGRKIPLFTC